ncbi:MAG: phage virion morphogenesis protein [Pseudomonadota bacterium]
MSAALFIAEGKGFAEAAKSLKGLAGFDAAQLMDDASAILESSARARLQEGKASPEGDPWPAWSPAYAKTRRLHHSLLVGEGELLQSIQSFATGDEARVGSPLVKAAIHQFGGEEVGKPNLPARAYLGVSEEDEEDLIDLVERTAAEAMQ